MNAAELVELAALVADHGAMLVAGGANLSAAGLEEYWTASRCRLDRWHRMLRRDRDPRAIPAEFDDATDEVQLATLEEILASEVLTRVWTAVLAAHDQRRGWRECEPIARSILAWHLEIRPRVLELMISHAGLPLEQAVGLNRLRRRVERWTDLLIGHLVEIHDVAEFAFDAERAEDFAADLRNQPRGPARRRAWALWLTSLRAAFLDGPLLPSPNADLNLRIASSVLACFSSDHFDSTGQFHSLWMLRLKNGASDAQGMVEQLLAVELPGEHLASDRRGPRRLR